MKLLLGKIMYGEFTSGSYLVISSLWYCYSERSSVHKILLLPVRVGQLGQEESM